MEPRPPDDDDLDRLLADHLGRQAARIDVGPLLSRICETSASQNPPAYAGRLAEARWRRLAGWALPVAIACGIAAVVFFPPRAEPLRASPQALLQEAQKAHHLPLDRCYLVEFQRTDDASEDGPPAALRTTRLWTRGDRFWFESTNPRNPWVKWAWGRDENGTIWVAPRPHVGVRVEADEVPPWLARMCDIHELRPEHLLGELLRDFDLVREEGETPATQVIRATRKPGRWAPPIRSAVLELDTETKALRRVVLDRTGPARSVTTTYTLVETQTQADDHYRLEGHLTSPSEIFTADNHPERRGQILQLAFGPRALDWFKPTPKEGPK
jgi:hypothetical protein